uniref:Uncharacterized protein n=1 Tax=viral metagenome TaxID=1070528 RepID=A0A6M3J8P2_9ZZZZ
MADPVDLAAARTALERAFCQESLAKWAYDYGDELIAAIAQKDAALRRHGRHDDDCALIVAQEYRDAGAEVHGISGPLVCTCGLAAALALTRDEKGGA